MTEFVTLFICKLTIPSHKRQLYFTAMVNECGNLFSKWIEENNFIQVERGNPVFVSIQFG
jgi:hypothetical protein